MKQFMREFKSYAVITLGILMYTFAVATFFVTNGIVSGGVSGLGTLLYYLSGNTIPVGATYFVVNAVLIAISLRILGSKFGIKTIYAMLVGSVSLWFFQELIPEPILDDKFFKCYTWRYSLWPWHWDGFDSGRKYRGERILLR